MPLTNRYQDYDPFAWFYNKYWSQQYCDWVLPLFETLLLKELPQEAHTLELGCGTGHLAQQFLLKGYQVSGLDESEAMLKYARKNAPGGKFMLGDIRCFKSSPTFHGVCSTGTFNHVMNLEALTDVFQNIYAALLPNGLLVFDINLDGRYQSLWKGSIDDGDVQRDYAWATRSIYNSKDRVGQVQITLFQLLAGKWQRSDITWRVRGYSQVEVQSALENAGFMNIKSYDAEHDFGVPRAAGRVFFVGYRQSN